MLLQVAATDIGQLTDIEAATEPLVCSPYPAPTRYRLRSPEQIAAFFEGLELAEPGLVPCPRWRPDPDGAADVRDLDECCALGRK
jgi:hypothetical protein